MSIEGRLVQEQHSSGVQCANLSESRITRIKGLHGRRERLYLAPEGRHVYSRAGYTNIIKPQRGDMWEPDTGKAIRESTPIYTNQNKI